MERERYPQDNHHSHLPPQSGAAEEGRVSLERVCEVGDDQDLTEWLKDDQIEVGIYQAQRVASESLRITRQTLAQIAEATEQFVILHPTIEKNVREMTERVNELLVRVPERALRNYLTRFDEETALRRPKECHPQPRFWERLRVRLPKRH